MRHSAPQPVRHNQCKLAWRGHKEAGSGQLRVPNGALAPTRSAAAARQRLGACSVGLGTYLRCQRFCRDRETGVGIFCIVRWAAIGCGLRHGRVVAP